MSLEGAFANGAQAIVSFFDVWENFCFTALVFIG